MSTPEVEAFHRDYPNASTNWDERVERNFWKYVPKFVARARVAAIFRVAQKRGNDAMWRSFQAVREIFTRQETPHV